jgi:hypothetical protein
MNFVIGANTDKTDPPPYEDFQFIVDRIEYWT